MVKMKLFGIILLSVVSICTVVSQAIDNISMLEIYVSKVDNDSVSFNIFNTTLTDTLYFSIFKQELLNEKYIVTSAYHIFSNEMFHGTLVYKLLPMERTVFITKPEQILYRDVDDEKWDEPVIVETIKCRFLLKATVNSCKKQIYKFYSNYIE